MSWLPWVDIGLPFGDAIYIIGLLIFAGVALSNTESTYTDSLVEVESFDSPQNNDDDDDDQWDDDQFGGRQKIGKGKGKTPGNNQAQNKQVRDAGKGLTKDQKRIVHDEISQQGYGFHEIVDIINELFHACYW